MAGALPKERRNLLSQLIFRLSRNGSCPQSCPQPSVVSTMMGGAILHTGPRLDGRQTPQSLQTPPVGPGVQVSKPDLSPLHLLALRRSVNPPKPTNPTNSPSLRVCKLAPLLSRRLAFRRKKTLQNPPNPTESPAPGVTLCYAGTSGTLIVRTLFTTKRTLKVRLPACTTDAHDSPQTAQCQPG